MDSLSPSPHRVFLRLLIWVSAFVIGLGRVQADDRSAAPWQKDMWSPVIGQWKVMDRTYYVQEDEHAWGTWSLWQGGRYTDVDVRVRFKIEPVGEGVRAAGIIFRAVDGHHFFYAHFDGKNNQILITRWSAEGGAKHLARLSRVGIRQGIWQWARVHCEGQHVTAYLDERRIGEADGASVLPGQVGLRTGQGRVWYADWHVEGTPTVASAATTAAEIPWWDTAWRRRIPVTICEPGHDDRDSTIARVRLSFDGRAHGFGLRREGAFDRTDIVVVNGDGRVTPSCVMPIKIEGKGDEFRIICAEVAFPVRVDWLKTVRYYAYFDNTQAPRKTKEELQMGTISLASLLQGGLPSDWNFVNGSWQRKELTRPERKRNAVAAVESERHVAFPGICMTKHGTLIAVYREGYSHASGNPDDGRLMLVRSTDKGKTWSDPELVYDDPTMDDRNAAIGCMNDGTLCVIWDKYLHGKHHWAWMIVSTDEGRTWSEPIKVSKDENVHTRSRVLDLGNGKWLIPYSESTHGPTTATYFSIYDPKTGHFDDVVATPRGQRNIADEVAVTRAPNGDLAALIRSNVDPALHQIVSKDDGHTWSSGRFTDIPSQFTPADLITLSNGWLLCSFSFRERRNERLVVSRDNGDTWDVENSVDVFDGTADVGGDRSYPASVQLDEETIGTVLYETRTPPQGGHIWFVTTKLSEFSAPKEDTLYQGDSRAGAAFAVWPQSIGGKTVEFAYRFTGLFGPPPNVVGLLLSFKDAENYAAFEFHMGAPKDRKSSPYNFVQLVECTNGTAKTLNGRTAQGGWFDDGNIHRLGARHEGDQWVLTIDGINQFSVPVLTGKPCGIIVRRAAVAVYEINWFSKPVQDQPGSIDIKTGPIEGRPRAEQ